MTAKTKQPKEAAQATAPATDTRVVYVGPTIIGLATRNTTYSEIPQELREAAKEAPYLLSLCVPIGRLPVALDQIRKQQGGIYTFYQKAQGYTPKQ
jgi:hypothetical protein